MKPSLITTSALVIFFASLSFAQTYNDVDPFLGSYTLGGQADLVMFNAQPDSFCEQMYGYFASDVPQQAVIFNWERSKVISTDGVSGNFLMGSPLDQGRDEAVCARMLSIGDSAIQVDVELMQFLNGAWSVSTWPIDYLANVHASKVSERMLVRMTSGYFDGGPAKEFVVAYNLPDSTQLITIRVFKLDSATYQPVEITSMRMDALLASLGTQAFFDIAAGDFDGDGLDELVLVKNNALTQLSGTSCTVSLRLHAYDFDWTKKQLVSKAVLDTSLLCGLSLQGGYQAGAPCPLVQLVTTSGDFNGDGRDEGVFGFCLEFTENMALFQIPVEIEEDSYLESFTLSADLTSFKITGSLLAGTEPISISSGRQYTTTMSLASSDLDRDGRDELVFAGMNDYIVYKLSDTFDFTRVSGFWCYSKCGYLSHRRIAIADIDGDTTFADSASSNWYPEIVTSEFTAYPTNQGTGGADNYNHIKVYKVTDPVNFAVSLKSDLTENYSGALAPTSMADGGILLGDFRGNAIRMGKPRRLAVNNLVEPAIIINAPPIHFDVLGDSCYDICKSYPIGNSSAFSSELVQSASNEVEASTNVHSSWGISSQLHLGGKFLGIGVEATIKAKYGEDFKNTHRTDSTMTASSSNQATWDDLIYATVTDYDLWEYPVYADGVKKGDVMAAIAHPQTAHWFSSNDGVYGNSIILDHEPGNLLSYPNYGIPENNPDLGQLIYKGDLYGISATGSAGKWELNWQKVVSDTADTSSNYGFSVGTSIGGVAVKLETEGSYDHGSINTHTTTVTRSIDMTANFGEINPLYASASYSVQPYAYWSTNGPLILDYLVDLDTTGVVKSFWEANYSQKPDLAFNCYYRYFAQKGLTLPAEIADWTKEISISPQNPKQGDTVTVMAEIHNYSLLATTVPVKIRFYLGSSETGGSVVHSLTGDTTFTTSSPVAARSDWTLSFSWRIPTGLSASDSILYAVIDPDNNIDELKKDNNKGWNRLNILGITAVHQATNLVTSFELSQNYPNPFNPSTSIEYALPQKSRVQLDVYDVLGRKVMTLVDKYEVAGKYKVEFNAAKLASGVYFYRLQAGSFTKTMKLLLLK